MYHFLTVNILILFFVVFNFANSAQTPLFIFIVDVKSNEQNKIFATIYDSLFDISPETPSISKETAFKLLFK